MTFFTSEYDSKLDVKGRLALPARIKNQLPKELGSEWVIRRGFEPCLVLYPMIEFKKIFFKISGLSEFNGEYRKLQRNLFSGTATIELDSHGRFVVPKNMLGYSHIEREIILVGMGNRVELWNPGLYSKHQLTNPVELSKLAQKHLNE